MVNIKLIIKKKKNIKKLLHIIKNSPLKLTDQRKSLVKIIFNDGDAHYTVDDVYKKAKKKNRGKKNALTRLL